MTATSGQMKSKEDSKKLRDSYKVKKCMARRTFLIMRSWFRWLLSLWN